MFESAATVCMSLTLAQDHFRVTVPSDNNNFRAIVYATLVRHHHIERNPHQIIPHQRSRRIEDSAPYLIACNFFFSPAVLRARKCSARSTTRRLWRHGNLSSFPTETSRDRITWRAVVISSKIVQALEGSRTSSNKQRLSLHLRAFNHFDDPSLSMYCNFHPVILFNHLSYQLARVARPACV